MKHMNFLLLLPFVFMASSCATSPRATSQGGIYKIGNPYEIRGTTYYPKEDYSYEEEGIASWYGPDFHKGKTANGEIYDMHDMTAAHRTLPLPSIVKVTNLENGKQVILRVNDRGPFVKNRIIDISKKGAEELGYLKKGTAHVRVEIMEKESKALKKAILSGKKSDFKIHQPTEILYAPQKQPEHKNISENRNDSFSDTCPEGFYIQLASFGNPENAQRLADEMKRKGPVLIYRTDVNNQSFYRVRLGPYQTGEEMIPVLDTIKKEGKFSPKLVKEVAY